MADDSSTLELIGGVLVIGGLALVASPLLASVCGAVAGGKLAAGVAAVIAGEWAGKETRDGWRRFCRRRLASGQLLNHDIEGAVQRAFVQAVRLLEQEWLRLPENVEPRWAPTLTAREQKQRVHEANRRAEEAFETLRVTAPRFFSANPLADESVAELRRVLDPEDDATEGALAHYLGAYLFDHEQRLRTFVADRLISRLALCFREELKTDGRAWVAFQMLLADEARAALSEVEARIDSADAEQREAIATLGAKLDMLTERRWETAAAALDARMTALSNEIVGAIGEQLGLAQEVILTALEREGTLMREAVSAGQESLFATLWALLPLLPVHGVNAVYLREQSGQWLEAHKRDAFGYIPEVYTPRPEMEASLDAFLAGEQSGFLMLGDAGMGKSTVLCQMVERWRERGEALLAYDGRTLTGDEDMEERARKDARFDGTVEQFLARLRERASRLVLVVDAVDRANDPMALLKQLCAVARRRAAARAEDGPPAVKVVFSFRNTLFEMALKAEGVERDDPYLFPHNVFQTRPIERQGRAEQTVEHLLERVDEADDLGTMYERYRAFDGRPFCPRTPFEALGLGTRKALSHPLFLRMAMETYHGQRMPGESRAGDVAGEPLWTGSILSAFTDKKLGRVNGSRELVEELVAHLRGRRSTSLVLDELAAVSPGWRDALATGPSGRSAYRALRDEGLLSETIRDVMIDGRMRKRPWVSISSDQLFEYLLAEDVRAEFGAAELDGKALATVLCESVEFRPMAGAAAYLLTDAAQSGRPEVVAATLEAHDNRQDFPIFLRVLTALEGMGGVAFELTLDRLADASKCPHAIEVLLDAAEDFALREHIQSSLQSSQRAAKAVERLGTDATNAANTSQLARALVIQGGMLSVLGRIDESLAVSNRTIAMIRSLVEDSGASGLAEYLVGALVNRGNAFALLGRNPDALVDFDAAIAILDREIVGMNELDLAPILAKTLMNRSAVLEMLSLPNEAFSTYKRVIDMLRRLTGETNRADLVAILAAALDHWGSALREVGQTQQAALAQEESVHTFRRLISEAGHIELWKPLADALLNSGATLVDLGRYSEALATEQEALAIYQRLFDDGLSELARDLADGYLNCGYTLDKMARSGEALSDYDRGIFIYRDLVQQGRTELMCDLANWLRMKALFLGGSNVRDLHKAMLVYDEAIALYQMCMEAGFGRGYVGLLKTIGSRMLSHIETGHFEEAGGDLLFLLGNVHTQADSESLPSAVQWHVSAAISLVCMIPEQDRQAFYAVLGDWASFVRDTIGPIESEVT